MSSPEHADKPLPLKADQSKSIAAWEIISITTSGLIAAWAINSFAGKGSWVGAIPMTLALALMLFSHRERGEGWLELGFRFDNFFAALRLLLIPTGVAVACFFLANWFFAGPGFTLRPARTRLLFVPFWSLFQQYVLQAFINRRARIVFMSSGKSVVVVGLVFAILHLPSPVLAALAFIGGVVWATVYQREPNLFALALSHAVTSVALSLTIPSNFAYLLRIGFKYLATILWPAFLR